MMGIYQHSFTLSTQGRGIYSIQDEVEAYLQSISVRTGLCHVFLHHTSASLIYCENADPSVKRDVETYFAKLVKDGDSDFTHTAEGPDDMSAHLRNILTHTSLSIPITEGRLNLGTWQGIYLYEHRYHHTHRKLTLTIIGA